MSRKSWSETTGMELRWLLLGYLPHGVSFVRRFRRQRCTLPPVPMLPLFLCHIFRRTLVRPMPSKKGFLRDEEYVSCEKSHE